LVLWEARRLDEQVHQTSSSSEIFPLQRRSVLAGSGRCSSVLVTVSCRRRKEPSASSRRTCTTVAIFVLTSAMERCFVSTCVTGWRHNEGDSVERGREELQEKRAGISKLFLGRVTEGGTRSLGGGASGNTVCQVPNNVPEEVLHLPQHLRGSPTSPRIPTNQVKEEI